MPKSKILNLLQDPVRHDKNVIRFRILYTCWHPFGILILAFELFPS
jgi:hypothetical protein